MIVKQRQTLFPFKARTKFLLYAIVLVLAFPVFSVAQKKGNTRAVKLFNNALEEYRKGQYQKAEDFIIQSIRRDSLQIEPYLLLSDISDHLRKPRQRVDALEKVISLDTQSYPLSYKLLGDLYHQSANYRRSLSAYEKYKAFGIARDSAYISRQIQLLHFALGAPDYSAETNIIPLHEGINTLMHEYWPAVTADDSLLFFTRLMRNPSGMAYERLLVANRVSGGWGTPNELEISGGEFVNEGTMCISADGKWLFFTACNRSDGLGSCDIYYSFKKESHWSAPVNAGRNINSKAWDAQPSVSADGQHLYFSSTREGGLGGMDIWFSKIKLFPNGYVRFGTPVHLGKEINTEKNDFSPFIHADGQTLYFASEGHLGFGGSDLFLSRNISGQWTTPENLGHPINSPKNDDGLVVSPTGLTAIYSSDREGAIGGSKDLFQFQIPRSLMPYRVGYLKGFVIDAKTMEPMEAQITLVERETGIEQIIGSDKSDGYLLTLKANHSYAINVTLPGYLFFSEHIEIEKTGEVTQAATRNIMLLPVETEQTMVLKNVLFDFNDHRLSPESLPELDKVANFLKENPTLEVEISGHTDNTGSREYNIELSEKRAKSIVDYLSATINTARLKWKGYGPDRPIGDNNTDEGRALNRRSEMKIQKK